MSLIWARLAVLQLVLQTSQKTFLVIWQVAIARRLFKCTRGFNHSFLIWKCSTTKQVRRWRICRSAPIFLKRCIGRNVCTISDGKWVEHQILVKRGACPSLASQIIEEINVSRTYTPAMTMLIVCASLPAHATWLLRIKAKKRSMGSSTNFQCWIQTYSLLWSKPPKTIIDVGEEYHSQWISTWAERICLPKDRESWLYSDRMDLATIQWNGPSWPSSTTSFQNMPATIPSVDLPTLLSKRSVTQLIDKDS